MFLYLCCKYSQPPNNIIVIFFQHPLTTMYCKGWRIVGGSDVACYRELSPKNIIAYVRLYWNRLQLLNSIVVFSIWNKWLPNTKFTKQQNNKNKKKLNCGWDTQHSFSPSVIPLLSPFPVALSGHPVLVYIENVSVSP